MYIAQLEPHTTFNQGGFDLKHSGCGSAGEVSSRKSSQGLIRKLH